MTAPTPGAGSDDELREALRDEIAGWPIGRNYYSTTIDTGSAAEIADALLPVVRAYADQRAAEALDLIEASLDALDAEASRQEETGRFYGDSYLRHWGAAKATASGYVRADLVRARAAAVAEGRDRA